MQKPRKRNQTRPLIRPNHRGNRLFNSRLLIADSSWSICRARVPHLPSHGFVCMELLGVGPLELLFIFIIVLLIFNPKDIANSARSAGKNLRTLYRSDTYRTIKRASDEIRELPTILMSEAEKEVGDLSLDTKKISEDLKKMSQGFDQTGKEIREDVKSAEQAPPEQGVSKL
jgi:Sec-independent protein translocase protein TatA